MATRARPSKVATKKRTGKPAKGTAPSTSDDELPAVSLDDIARHYASKGTPLARRFARILSGASTAYLIACRIERPGGNGAPPPSLERAYARWRKERERERARACELLDKVEADLFPATGPRGRNRPSVAMERDEVIRDAAMWIGGWLAAAEKWASDAGLTEQAMAAVCDLALGVVRAFGLGTEGVREKLATKLAAKAKLAESGRLAPTDAPRIIEAALVLARMPKGEPHKAVAILWKK